MGTGTGAFDERIWRESPVSILLLSADLVILDATDQYLADTMTVRDEIVGRHLFEVFPENPDEIGGDDGVSALRASMERVLATGRPDALAALRYDVPRPEGGRFEERYWNPVNTPLLDDDGRVVCINHHVSDVTDYVVATRERTALDARTAEMEREIVERSRELREANDALRASEERFRLVTDATSDALWDWDVRSDERWWSDGFERLFGHRPADLSRYLDSWTELIHPEDHDAVLDSLREAMEGDADSWSRDYRLVNSDGEVRWVIDQAGIIRDEHGTAVRLVGGMRDVTERVRAEQQALRSQRMESIGTLAGGIAHDLNNVLAPIMMAADLMLLDADDPQQREMLGTIATSTRRGADMVQQVLSFARGVEGRRLAVSVGDLLRGIERVVETFPRDISIDVGDPGPGVAVSGDATQLHQVLLNVCLNARDAMPNGGTLTVRAEPVEIDEQYAAMSADAASGSYVVVRVEDTGIGMGPEILDRLFEPFFTTKPTGKGTGLGLPTSAGIVRSHGGFVRVYSEPGRGTAFDIYLPAATPDAATPVADDADLPRGHGELVLVVDDEDAVVQMTSQTLELFGYRVATASDGAQAVAHVAAGDPEVDVVVTDMMMPVLDGPATINVLRRMRPDLPIIAASGLNADGSVARAADAGVEHFLPKPYTAAALLGLLREVLDRGVSESSSPRSERA